MHFDSRERAKNLSSPAWSPSLPEVTNEWYSSHRKSTGLKRRFFPWRDTRFSTDLKKSSFIRTPTTRAIAGSALRGKLSAHTFPCSISSENGGKIRPYSPE